MNYEEKYNQTIESIKRIYEQADSFGKELMEKEFPELRESDDERIREFLYKTFTAQYLAKDKLGKWHGKPVSNILAWLEKQGEQKTEIEYIYPKFRIGDVIVPIKPNGYYTPVRVLSIEKKTKSYYCESDDHKHYSSIPIRCEDEYKLVKKNLAWSEEDNKMLNSVIQRIKELDHYWNKPTDEKMVDWIKSLKPNHWKPSEFQLECLNKVIPHNNTEKDCELEDVLTELYNDLKNL